MPKRLTLVNSQRPRQNVTLASILPIKTKVTLAGCY
uniref:Uncharacterized protein n=1 Tax=Anguilla anguilla TaxID=7936 RepID=A0A0E9UUP3_ANGAN